MTQAHPATVPIPTAPRPLLPRRAVIETAQASQIITIQNDGPAIEELDMGRSDKAPAGSPTAHLTQPRGEQAKMGFKTDIDILRARFETQWQSLHPGDSLHPRQRSPGIQRLPESEDTGR